jgi:hypothetical protein
MSINYNNPWPPRPAPKHKKRSIFDAVLVALVIAGSVVAAYFLQAWLLMLFLGAVHLELWNKVPPFGLVASLLLAIAINGVMFLAKSIIK